MNQRLRHIGYGLGDMSSSMFWKIFSYYLPFFYSNIMGLSLNDAGIILLVTRLWDAISDPMMGVIADRTQTRWGKYRPYLISLMAVVVVSFYPLSETRMRDIEAQLLTQRSHD